MKAISAAALDAIAAGTVIVSGAVAIYCDDPVWIWGGWGELTIDGEAYFPVGDRALAQMSGAAIGGSAQDATISLSGVDPLLLPLLDAAGLRGASAKLTRLVFDSSGTRLLDAQVFTRGRVDLVTIDDTIGDTAIVSVKIEGAARGLGRRGARMRTDADQRLVSSTDGSLRHVSYAAEKKLYWGGKVPERAGSATGSGGIGGALSGFVARQRG